MHGSGTNGQSLRLFVALDLPPSALDALVAWRDPLVAGSDALRAVDRASLHVTLCFLGLRPASSVGELSEACSVLSGRAVGALALGAAVWLPRRRPGVLACAVDDDHGELREAQALVASRLRALEALDDEPRIFFPHATVARVERGHRVRATAPPGPEPVGFDGPSVTLYRSVLGGGPARYESLHRITLAGG